MKLLAYLRVSTTGQVGEDKFGFDSQLADIKKYCQENKHEIVKIVREQISGAKDNRPLFNEILYGDSDVDYDGIIVAKIDRLSRKVETYFGFKYLLKQKGIELLSANENEEFSKMGVFASVFEAFISAMSEIEREKIAERTTGGRMIKASGGGYSGGKAPYGYKVSDKQLVIDETESERVKIIYDLRSKGYSMMKIKNYLDNNNMLTRKGKKWQTSTIKSILDNEDFYKGIYSYSTCENVVGKHQALF